MAWEKPPGRNSITPNQQCFPRQQTSTPICAGSTAHVFGGGVVHFLGSGNLDSYLQRDFQGPPRTPENGKRDPHTSFPNPTPMFESRNSMGPAYHKGVPLLGVPGITLDILGFLLSADRDEQMSNKDNKVREGCLHLPVGEIFGNVFFFNKINCDIWQTG